MAPTISTTLVHQARSFIAETIAHLPQPDEITARGLDTSSPLGGGSPLGPLAGRSLLKDRAAAPAVDPGKGVVHAADINNNAIFAVFGIIGAGFVVIGIWFFFWAKNGGFYFKDGDWEDYKSTVLRRKGPNGTLLSGATPSTNLGGGSVYKDVDDTTTTVSDSTGLTGITAGVSDIAGRERRRKKLEKKDREKEAKETRRREKKKKEKDTPNSARRHVGEDGILIDEEAEREAKQHLRSYRHERPARVGGLNKQSDSSTWDGSTNPTESSTASSDLLSNRQRTPTSTPTKSGGGGIRKVYSTSDRTAERENERIKAEARRLQEKGRAAGVGGSSNHRSRDFSSQRAESTVVDSTRGARLITDSESRVPGSWAESDIGTASVVSSGDIGGTKSYRHHIPGLSSSGSGAPSSNEYADERRKKRAARAGYRRGGDGFSDVDIS
jgi:hypothetical protein